MKKTFAAVLAVAATAAIVTSAYAFTVSYNPETGGWAGKGDVQAAFGWNNKTMQANHAAITFSYTDVTEVTFDCTWTTGPAGNKTTHVNSFETTYGIAGTIADGDRKTGQWTGWHLSPISGGNGGDPEAAADCPGNEEGGGNSGTKTLVPGSVVATSIGAVLSATFNGDTRPLN